MKYITIIFSIISVLFAMPVQAAYHFADYTGHPPIHVQATTGSVPKGMTPDQIKKAYGIPNTGGKGTIVIIGAYSATNIEQDLQAFDSQFKLPACTVKNACLTKHLMGSGEKAAPLSWSLETALDVEWAHAIAPEAKILLVEAATPSGAHLLDAIDYASKRKDATAISMSWGGAEFPEETGLDSHFMSSSSAPFFASSGDSGTGVSWPAASPSVISVGGTSLHLDAKGSVTTETAWSNSGGGVSAYEKEPAYQVAYAIPRAKGMRAVPDVAYDADPATGFPIVHAGVWRTVGGTSAGAPQWAAIASVGSGITDSTLYAKAASSSHNSYFRDIVSGTNGSCAYFCSAHAGYDHVTGLGTPKTADF